MIYVGIVTCHFFAIAFCNSVIALDYNYDFVSVQYLKTWPFYSMKSAAEGLCSDSLTILV